MSSYVYMAEIYLKCFKTKHHSFDTGVVPFQPRARSLMTPASKIKNKKNKIASQSVMRKVMWFLGIWASWGYITRLSQKAKESKQAKTRSWSMLLFADVRITPPMFSFFGSAWTRSVLSVICGVVDCVWILSHACMRSYREHVTVLPCRRNTAPSSVRLIATKSPLPCGSLLLLLSLEIQSMLIHGAANYTHFTLA